MKKVLLCFTFVCLFVVSETSGAEPIGKKGRIRGESYVNLRSGPNLSSPAKAVLREGDEVTVEREEGNWYLISLKDGNRGYVHKTLVHLIGDVVVKEAPKEVAKEVPEESEVTEPSEVRENDVLVSSTQRFERQAPKGRPMSIIKLLEGREWDILWWIGVALCIFILGWICGGNYYLYRDRVRRKKLHF